MPTPAEQKALAFVALVVLLGGVVRVVRGGVPPTAPTPAEQQALAQQASAANSSASRAATAKGTSGKARKGPRVARRVLDTVPFSDTTPLMGPTRRPLAPRRPALSGLPHGPIGTFGPLDLDTASELEIEALPRVGPALARRIVANRDSVGPFGGIEALRRVRGIGPATLQRLRPLVTFSGQTRR